MVGKRCKHIMSMLGNTWNKLGIRRSKKLLSPAPTSFPPIGTDFDVLVYASWFHWLWNFFPKFHWLCIFAPTNAFILNWKRKERKKNVLEVLLTFYLVSYLHYLYFLMLGSWRFWLLYIHGHMYEFFKIPPSFYYYY